MPKRKRVLSFDFDGCLFNLTYMKANDRDVVQHNLEFLEYIKSENSAFEKVTCFIGSNRQSKALDDNNRYAIGPEGFFDKGSCFPAIRVLSEYLNASLDATLLADIVHDLPEGESYRRATTSDYQGDHVDTYFDGTKLTLLYAQIHKAAMEDPTAEIIYDFYDDREDILYALKEFFKRSPGLIPQNVTLRLNQYAGKREGALLPVYHASTGEGFIDSNYRLTVKHMFEHCFKESFVEPSYMREVSVAYILSSEVLTTRVPHCIAVEALEEKFEQGLMLEAASEAPVKEPVYAKDPKNTFFASASVLAAPVVNEAVPALVVAAVVSDEAWSDEAASLT